MEKYVIIVAGGSGKRMGAAVPKQFIPVAGKPVLMHTLQAFYNYDAHLHLILVLPQDHKATWQQLCDQYAFSLPCQVVSGGEERFFSVQNALAEVPTNALVAVHDGVRPLVSKETIEKAFSSAKKYQSGIPVIPSTDSLRRVVGTENEAVCRAEFFRVQTPQVFASTLLKKAYEQEYTSLFTDDASVVEALGEKVHLTEGNLENIKLTTPMDLQWAELLLKNESLSNGY